MVITTLLIAYLIHHFATKKIDGETIDGRDPRYIIDNKNNNLQGIKSKAIVQICNLMFIFSLGVDTLRFSLQTTNCLQSLTSRKLSRS